MAEADLAWRVLAIPGRAFCAARRRCLEGWLLGLRTAEFATLSVFVLVASLASFYHEPWSDEAQAWLIARDLSIPQMFSLMTYEGSPPLWHLLLKALIGLHLPYGALGVVSITLMSGAMYLWLRWSPLPRLLRLLMPFAFYFQYQYAVVARSYALSIFLAFTAAWLWREGVRRMVLLGVILALLVETNLYGFVMGAGIALAFACEYWRELKNKASRRRKIEIAIALVVLAASCLIAAALARPSSDSSSAAGTTLNTQVKTADAFSLTSRARSGEDVLYKSLGLSSSWKVAALMLLVVWTIGIKNRIHYALPLVLTALVIWQGRMLTSLWEEGLLVLLLFWFLRARKLHCALPFVFTVLSLGLIWARHQHYGMALAALAISLWMSWPAPSSVQHPANSTFTLQTALMFALVLQLPGTLAAVVHEIREPYSGATAAAEYIRPYVGKHPIYAFTFFPVGLQPYFAGNIYVNQSETPWVWSKTSENRVKAPLLAGMEAGAMAVVVSAGNSTGPLVRPLDTMLSQQQMRSTHAFCGRMFWFETESEIECFEIYEKRAQAAVATEPRQSVLH